MMNISDLRVATKMFGIPAKFLILSRQVLLCFWLCILVLVTLQILSNPSIIYEGRIL